MREYALVFAVAAAVTYLTTPVARRFAVRIGAMAQPRDRDVHAIPTPRLGGLALYAGIAVAMLVAERLPALQEAFATSLDPQALLVSGAVVCLLGVVDDRWGLDALTKLTGQVVAAGVMCLYGVQLLFVAVPGRNDVISLPPELAVPITVLLVVVTINAINFIDGLDGLAAGVVAIGALALVAYCYQLAVVQRVAPASPPMLLAAVTAGACLGFLPHNFNPARVFMGDSGSMLIGLMLAGTTTSLTGQVDFTALPDRGFLPVLLPLLLPLAVLAVPFVDLVLAVVRRTRAGRSPFAPDKLHLHHRLLEIGHSHVRAVLVIYLWTGALGFSAVALAIYDGPAVALSVAIGLLVVAAVASAVPRLRMRGPS